MPDNRKPLIYGDFPVCRNYTVRAHICYVSPTKRRGRQNRQQHAGPLRCRIHLANLHPRYEAEARRGRTDHGQLYGAGDVNAANDKSTGEKAKASSPVLFGSIGIFPRVGHGVGQAVAPHFAHTSFNIFTTKKHRKPKFSMLFGAAGRIRTADLILTKDALYLLSYSSICGDQEGARTLDLQRDRLAF